VGASAAWSRSSQIVIGSPLACGTEAVGVLGSWAQAGARTAPNADTRHGADQSRIAGARQEDLGSDASLCLDTCFGAPDGVRLQVTQGPWEVSQGVWSGLQALADRAFPRRRAGADCTRHEMRPALLKM
jgi:hypothetical protein